MLSLRQILREMVFPPLPAAEWRRPQQQQQQQQQRRASSVRHGGSAPSSPLSGRRLSVSPRVLNPSGGGQGSPNSRRRLSMAAPSLSGLLSPRYNTDSPSSAPKRVTSRSLSPPASPDHGKQQRSQAREERRQQREMLAVDRGGEPSPPQHGGSARSRRRKSVSMSWSAASFSSILPSSSSGPSTRAAAFCPPPPSPAASGCPPSQLDYQPLSPRLAVTVVPAVTGSVLSDDFPPRSSAGGATSPTGVGVTASAGEMSTLGTSAGGCTTVIDGSYHKLAALEGDDSFRLKTRPTRRGEEAAEEAPVGVLLDAPLLVEETATSTIGGRRSSGGKNDDAGGAGGTGALSSVFGEAEGRESGVDAAGEMITANANATEQEQKLESGEGGPTQVLCVPEIATRDTEEYLGIQVRKVAARTSRFPLYDVVGCVERGLGRERPRAGATETTE